MVGEGSDVQLTSKSNEEGHINPTLFVMKKSYFLGLILLSGLFLGASSNEQDDEQTVEMPLSPLGTRFVTPPGYMSRSEALKAINLLAEKGRLDLLVNVLQQRRNVDVLIGIVEKLRDIDAITVLPGLLEVWKKTPKYIMGSENATVHGIYMRKLLLLIWHLTGETIPLYLDKEALSPGPEPYSQEAIAIINHAKAWWKTNGHLHGAEPPPHNGVPAVRKPHLTKKDPSSQMSPAPVATEPSSNLWPIWLGATALCAAIAGGVLYLRRKRHVA